MGTTTKRDDADDAGTGGSAVYWFLAMKEALRMGQRQRALEAQAELVKLGVTVVVDAESPLRRRPAGQEVASA